MDAIRAYAKCDALGLTEMVRSKKISPAELVEEAIRRTEKYNPELNAVIYKMYDQARAEAKSALPGGPFRGVPFFLKDILPATYAGVPTSCGCRLLKDAPMPADSELVRRFRQAGVIVVGKTNTPEFGMTHYTEPETFGPTHNPWDLARTPGGSSGGSAAAVAARLVPIAHGSDGGGSIRTPASCCGIFGLKPSRGRIPTGPTFGELWQGLAIDHVLTRSVRDSAAMLDAIAGADVGAPYAAPLQTRPFLQEVTAEPGKLRIAFTPEPFLGHALHDDCKQGLEASIRLLEQLGHTVVQARPQIDREPFAHAHLSVIMANATSAIEEVSALIKRKPSAGEYDVPTEALSLMGSTMSAADYVNALDYLETTSREIARFFETYDLFLTSTLSEPPFPIGAQQPSGAERALIRFLGALDAGWLLKAVGAIEGLATKAYDWVSYSPVFNVTGQPAMSVPLYWNQAGLPIGVHFAGRFGDEATLFRVAGQLERAQPWFDRAPAGFAD